MNRFRPTVEVLEKREVPAGLTLDWTPPAGSDHSWTDAACWTDTTTGNAPANPPSQYDTVHFRFGGDGNVVVTAGNTGVCAALIADIGWGGIIEMEGNGIYIAGKNNAANAQSAFGSGSIEGIVANGALSYVWLDGGSMDYAGPDVGTLGTSPVTVQVYNGGVWNWTAGFSDLQASLAVGFDKLGNNSPGTMQFTQLTNIVVTHGSCATTVGPSGSLIYDDSVIVTGVRLTSAGAVALNPSSRVSLATTLMVTGGTLSGPNTDTAALTGNVNVSDATVFLGTANNQYGTLSVSGSVTMSNSTLSLDVNGNSLTVSDVLSVGTLNIDGTDTLLVHSSAAPIAGDHAYTVVSATTLNGTFGTVSCVGYAWPVFYQGGVVSLVAVVQPQGGGG